PAIKLTRGRIFGRAPGRGVVGLNKRLQPLADIAKEGMLTHVLDRAVKALIGFDKMDIDIVKHEEAAMSRPDDAWELGRVRLGDDRSDLLLAIRLDSGHDQRAVYHGESPELFGGFEPPDEARRSRGYRRVGSHSVGASSRRTATS